jgi:photosystem II cytochrome b559 subunit alpha
LLLKKIFNKIVLERQFKFALKSNNFRRIDAMAGTTGERPLGEIITEPGFWILHVVNIPAIFISGWFFISTGLAYDVFGTPHPNEYFLPNAERPPIVSDRFGVQQQLDEYFRKQQELFVPAIDSKK